MLRRIPPAFALYATLGLILALVLYGLRFDDPFITYRYAENLAAGRGFVFNPDNPFGPPALITTAPLYAVLLGGLRIAGFDVPLTSYLIGAGSIVAGASALYTLLQQTQQTRAAFFAGLCFVLFPLLWLTLGFEAPLFIALALSAFVAVQRRQWVWAGVLCGLGLGLRGDGAIVLGVCALAILWTTWLDARATIHLSMSQFVAPVLRLLIAAFLIYAPLAIGLTLQYGTPIPSTLQTKSAQAISGLTGFYPNTSYPEGALLLIQSYAQQGGLFIVTLFAMLVGIGTAVQVALQRRTTALIWLAPVAWLLVHGLGYTAIRVAPYVWYYAPLVPGVCVLVGLGLAWLWSRMAIITDNTRQRRAASVSKIIVPVAMVGSLLIADGLIARIVHGAQPPDPAQVASKVLPETKVEIYQRVGEWLNANTPAHATIGVTELGVMSYYADRPIVDFLGLVQPEHRDDIRHGDFAAGLIRQQPDYVALTHVNALYDANPQTEAWFTRLYTPVAIFEDARFWGSPMTIWQRTRAPLTAPITLTISAPTLGDGWSVTSVAITTRTIEPDAPLLIQVRLQAGDAIGNRTLRVQAEWLDGNEGLPVVSRLIFTDRWQKAEQAWISLPLVVPAHPQAGAYAITLRWLEGGEIARAGHLKVPPERPALTPDESTVVPLGEGIAVARLPALDATPQCNNAQLDVPVLWRGGASIQTDYTAFVQLRAQGAITPTASGDGPPRNNGLRYPTSVWSAGEWIADTHTIAPNGTIAPGRYDIVVGLYEPVTGARLPVAESSFRTADGGVNIATVEIKAC